MVPAQVTRQRRQSRLTVWDRAGMGAAVISELESRQLVYVNRKIGRMSSIGHSKYAVAVEPRGHMKRVVGRVLRQVVRSDGGEADFRIGDRVMAVIRWDRLHRGIFAGCMGWMGTAVISELEARQLVYINGKIGRMSSIGHSKYAVAVELPRHMKRVVGRVLRQVVRSDGGEVDFRIRDCVMVVILLRLHRDVFSGCMGWMGAAVIKPEGSRLVYVRMRMGRLSAIGHSKGAAVVEPRGHMKQVIGRVLQR